MKSRNKRLFIQNILNNIKRNINYSVSNLQFLPVILNDNVIGHVISNSIIFNNFIKNNYIDVFIYKEYDIDKLVIFDIGLNKKDKNDYYNITEIIVKKILNNYN